MAQQLKFALTAYDPNPTEVNFNRNPKFLDFNSFRVRWLPQYRWKDIEDNPILDL